MSSVWLRKIKELFAGQRRTDGDKCLWREKPGVPVVEDKSRGPLRYSPGVRVAESRVR